VFRFIFTRARPLAKASFAHFRAGPLLLLQSLHVLQHLVDERSKIHLDSVEFTLAYRDGVRKVVDNLGKGLVNLDRGSMTLPRRMTAATDNFCDIGAL